jgi:hypothetical protein
VGGLFRAGQSQLNLLKWSYRVPFKPSNLSHKIHILIIRDKKYVGVAKICIYSFLYWHPNAEILVHVDEFTAKKVKRAFRRLIKREKIKVLKDVAENDLPWQYAKLKLILCLSGSTDIFLDADLRWNAVLPDIHGITFFVNEFLLAEREDFILLLNEMKFTKLENLYMRNLSFFTFDGFHLSEKSKYEIERLWNNIILAQKNLRIDSSSPTLGRISEQLVFSLACQSWNSPIYALKSTDGLKDGEFVESTYFGVTGLKF